MTRRSSSFILAGALACIAAAPTDPGAQIKVRHDGMKQIGAAFKQIAQQVKSGTPDARVVAPAAATVKRLSVAQLDWFPKGSGPESGLKTHTKAAAWTDPAGFRTAQQNFVAEAAKLNAVAVRGDMAALPAQFKATGQTCGGCHDKYREKDAD